MGGETVSDKFPEDGSVLALGLFLELVNSLFRYSFFIHNYDANARDTCDAYRNITSQQILDETLDMYYNETNGNGFGGIIAFSVLLLPLLVVFIIVSVCYILVGVCPGCHYGDAHHPPILTIISCCCKNGITDHSHMSYIATLVQWLLVTLYFIGDNLGPVLSAHGVEIGCSGSCVENALTILKVLSVSSPLLLHLAPYVLHHIGKLNSNLKYKIKEEATLLGLLGNILKVDATYTALTVFAQVGNRCSDAREGLNWAILAVCAFGGAVYIAIKIRNGLQSWHDCFKKPISFIGFIVLFLLLACYLIGDNGTPLDCRFFCDANGLSGIELSHPLLDKHCCNIHDNTIIRLALMCVASFLTFVVAIVAGVIMCCKTFL